VLIGEVERLLGLGPELIAISADMFVDMVTCPVALYPARQAREAAAGRTQTNPISITSPQSSVS
jgi:hypothetical protein